MTVACLWPKSEFWSLNSVCCEIINPKYSAWRKTNHLMVPTSAQISKPSAPSPQPKDKTNRQCCKLQHQEIGSFFPAYSNVGHSYTVFFLSDSDLLWFSPVFWSLSELYKYVIMYDEIVQYFVFFILYSQALFE
jgi:hypothetical protein